MIEEKDIEILKRDNSEEVFHSMSYTLHFWKSSKVQCS